MQKNTVSLTKANFTFLVLISEKQIFNKKRIWHGDAVEGPQSVKEKVAPVGSESGGGV